MNELLLLYKIINIIIIIIIIINSQISDLNCKSLIFNRKAQNFWN